MIDIPRQRKTRGAHVRDRDESVSARTNRYGRSRPTPVLHYSIEDSAPLASLLARKAGSVAPRSDRPRAGPRAPLRTSNESLGRRRLAPAASADTGRTPRRGGPYSSVSKAHHLPTVDYARGFPRESASSNDAPRRGAPRRLRTCLCRRVAPFRLGSEEPPRERPFMKPSWLLSRPSPECSRTRRMRPRSHALGFSLCSRNGPIGADGWNYIDRLRDPGFTIARRGTTIVSRRLLVRWWRLETDAARSSLTCGHRNSSRRHVDWAILLTTRETARWSCSPNRSARSFAPSRGGFAEDRVRAMSMRAGAAKSAIRAEVGDAARGRRFISSGGERRAARSRPSSVSSGHRARDPGWSVSGASLTR